MLVPCSVRLARFGLQGSLLLLALGCAPAEPNDPIDYDDARGGVFVDGGYVEGRFESRIATMLDGTTRISHHVHAGDQVFQVVLEDGTDIPAYDSFVRVPGELDGEGRWQADELVLLAPPPQPSIDAERRPARRLGAVIVFWDGQGLPNAQANDSLFTGNKSTNVYYGENSYGIETMAGKTFGPYQIDDPGACNVDFISNQADQAMIEKGWDPTDFRQMMYYFPGGLGCGFAGLASIGSPDAPARNSWYSGSFGCTTRNQELGHNYGMGHSHAYSCPPTPDGMDHNFYEDCEHIEYGHPYDPMGNGCGHMNVVQKTYMGWLEGCNVVTATSDGVFNLMPTELPCSGTQSLVFPAYDGRYYQIEYRNGSGQFAVGSGILVNIAPQVQGFGPTGYVLDELGSLGNGYLHAGDSFTDPGGAVTFEILEENESHAVIQLTIPDGGDGASPTCRDGGAPIDEAGAVGSLECAVEPYPGDTVAPEVTITYPADGDNFLPGADFTITADATDDREVIEVELYLNGESFNVLTAPPWEWEAAGIPEGTYEFGVIARDSRYWTPSQAVTIHVGEPAPPADTGVDESGGDDAMATDGDATAGSDDSSGATAGAVEPTSCECNQGGGGQRRPRLRHDAVRPRLAATPRELGLAARCRTMASARGPSSRERRG